MTRYILLEKLGSGSSGVVHKARDTLMGVVVAIKELGKQAGLPKREAALAWRVTHENVCRIHGVFVSETGSICISMEFVDGGNLRDLMEKSGALPVEKCLFIAHQIL